MSFYHLSRKICFIFIRCFFKIKISGLDNLLNAPGGLVIVANHQSNLDPVLLGLCVNRRLFFMAKKELFSVPILGYIIKKLGAFPVKRGAHDCDSINFAKKLISENKIIAMFPEGTRSKNGLISKFKTGAVRIALTGEGLILPSSIYYFKRQVFIEYGQIINLKKVIVDCGFNLNKLTLFELKQLSEIVRQNVLKIKMKQKKVVEH